MIHEHIKKMNKENRQTLQFATERLTGIAGAEIEMITLD